MTNLKTIYISIALWLCTAAIAQATILPTYTHKGTQQTYTPANNTLSDLQQTSTWENMYHLKHAHTLIVETVRPDFAGTITPHNLYLGGNTNDWKVRSFGSTVSTSRHFSALQMSREGSIAWEENCSPTGGGPRKVNVNRPTSGGSTGNIITPMGDGLVPLLIALLMYTIVVAWRRLKETLQ